MSADPTTPTLDPTPTSELRTPETCPPEKKQMAELAKHPLALVIAAVLSVTGGNAVIDSWKSAPANIQDNGEQIAQMREAMTESNRVLSEAFTALNTNTQALTDAMVGRYDPVTHELLKPGLRQHLEAMAETQAEAARVHESNTAELIRVRKALEAHGNLTVTP